MLRLFFCQVGPGEGVINLRASAAPFKGLKLNTEAKSSWKLTVDAVQVTIAVFFMLEKKRLRLDPLLFLIN